MQRGQARGVVQQRLPRVGVEVPGSARQHINMARSDLAVGEGIGHVDRAAQRRRPLRLPRRLAQRTPRRFCDRRLGERRGDFAQNPQQFGATGVEEPLHLGGRRQRLAQIGGRGIRRRAHRVGVLQPLDCLDQQHAIDSTFGVSQR